MPEAWEFLPDMVRNPAACSAERGSASKAFKASAGLCFGMSLSCREAETSPCCESGAAVFQAFELFVAFLLFELIAEFVLFELIAEFVLFELIAEFLLFELIAELLLFALFEEFLPFALSTEFPLFAFFIEFPLFPLFPVFPSFVLLSEFLADMVWSFLGTESSSVVCGAETFSIITSLSASWLGSVSAGVPSMPPPLSCEGEFSAACKEDASSSADFCAAGGLFSEEVVSAGLWLEVSEPFVSFSDNSIKFVTSNSSSSH